MTWCSRSFSQASCPGILQDSLGIGDQSLGLDASGHGGQDSPIHLVGRERRFAFKKVADAQTDAGQVIANILDALQVLNAGRAEQGADATQWVIVAQLGQTVGPGGFLGGCSGRRSGGRCLPGERLGGHPGSVPRWVTVGGERKRR